MKKLQHQIAVCLSLTFVTKDDNNQTNYATFPLAYITRLFLILSTIWPTIRTIAQATITGYKLAQIVLSSVAFTSQSIYIEMVGKTLGGLPCPA